MSDLLEFGAHVRIRSDELTKRLGFAGRNGLIYGFTKPSSINADVVGVLSEDVAYRVHFENDEEAWFARELIEGI